MTKSWLTGFGDEQPISFKIMKKKYENLNAQNEKK